MAELPSIKAVHLLRLGRVSVLKVLLPLAVIFTVALILALSLVTTKGINLRKTAGLVAAMPSVLVALVTLLERLARVEAAVRSA